MARSWRRIGILTVALTGALLPAMSAASSQVEPVNHLTVRKIVLGPAPPDATFTIHLDCFDFGYPDNPVLLDEVVTFPAQGGEETFDVPGSVDESRWVICSAKETGAFLPPPAKLVPWYPSPPYSCTVTNPGTPTLPDAPAAFCGFLRDSVDLTFPGSRADVSVVLTITNRFVEPPPSPSPSIVLAPTFTG